MNRYYLLPGMGRGRRRRRRRMNFAAFLTGLVIAVALCALLWAVQK